MKFIMVDWKGLLNWTLKYQDGTKPSDFKEMSAEDAKWLEEAFNSVSFNEFKETIKRLDELKSLDDVETDEIIENKLQLVEDISILCDNNDIVRNVVKAKRFEEIIKYAFNTKNKELRLNFCSLLALMLQNHKFAQEAALSFNIFNIVNIIENESDVDVISKMLYILCGLLYGDFTEPRKRFISEYNGLEVLKKLIQRKYTSYLRRVISIFVELTKHEEVEDDHVIRNTTLEFLKFSKNYFIFIDLLFGSYREEGLYEDIRSNIYNLLKNIYCLFEKKDINNIIEKSLKMLSDSKIDSSVKDHEQIQLKEILVIINQDESNKENKNSQNKVNVHFIDPKNINLEAKDLEGLTIIDKTSEKKEEKKEESKVLMLK